jgi:mannose-1-phosphate guanylyltransferase
MSFATKLQEMSPNGHHWAVVLAGGDGMRLRELAYRIAGDVRPKQFCSFFGGKTLLAHTRERIAPCFADDRTLFALARAHEKFYRRELWDIEESRRIVQPLNRGTAVAMALCLDTIIQQDEDAVVAFFPSDHHYLNCSAFRESVEHALGLVEDYPQSLLIMGVKARSPESEYGWIVPGRTLLDSLIHPLHRVARFWEKPPVEQAQVLERRGCLWNTFITIGLAGTFLELIRVAAPELLRWLGTRGKDGSLDSAYENIAPVDFSKGVLTRMPARLMVQQDAASGWTDLGSPGRVMEVLTRQGVVASRLSSPGAAQRDLLEALQSAH